MQRIIVKKHFMKINLDNVFAMIVILMMAKIIYVNYNAHNFGIIIHNIFYF